MKGTRPTPLTREEIPAVEARIATATPGEWQACRMVMEGEDRPLTAEEIGEYVMNSVRKSATESGTEDFLFIYVEKPNGPADVCHVGNGPTSPENADFIAHARADLPRAVAGTRAWWELRARIEALANEMERCGSGVWAQATRALLVAPTEPTDGS
jgi:hypothetical protein